MKRFVDILKAVCPIGAAIVIYMTVLKAAAGGEAIIFYVVASVLSCALCVSLFLISSLSARVERLEGAIRAMADDTYDEEPPAVKECPVCHAYFDEDEKVCPKCGGVKREEAFVFATDDPGYNGTDFSGEEYVSAHTPEDREL